MPSPTLQGHERPTPRHKEEEKEKAKERRRDRKKKEVSLKNRANADRHETRRSGLTGPPTSARLSINKNGRRNKNIEGKIDTEKRTRYLN